MSEQDLTNFEEIEFAENPDDRLALAIIIDESHSMKVERPGLGVPIDELNNALDDLVTELHNDPLARRRCEVSFITYSTDVNTITDFATVDNMVLPTLNAQGVTSTGKAINAGLDHLEARKAVYRKNGIRQYRSMVVFMTDGLQTDDISGVSERIDKLEKNKSLIFFPIGISGYDKEGLKQICPPGKDPVGLQGLNFSSFFQWLSSSVSSVSASQPDDKLKLESPAGWAEF